MIIKVLGSGCSNCTRLEKNVLKALNNLNMEASVEKVTDLKTISSFNVLSTPALAINDKVVFSGKVPNSSTLEKIIAQFA